MAYEKSLGIKVRPIFPVQLRLNAKLILPVVTLQSVENDSPLRLRAKRPMKLPMKYWQIIQGSYKPYI